ncbi:adenine deaminase [Saprospiraceae bacterium]|nr:adenine deaminase [Saprospiraceae bacterium]
MIIKGQFVDLQSRSIYPASINIVEGIITSIERILNAPDYYIIPGFVDAHIHIESSMLIPSQFARLAVTHGTVATVSDPHEIANVLGMPGVDFMIEDAAKTPLKFFFGAPSCVPPTTFETSGAILDANDIKTLLARDDIKYLAEMMNYPGVLYRNEEVMQKLQHAKDAGKPIDGHAPGLLGDQAHQYINAGISTDHECYTYEEAKHKLDHGMKILIREGSAAKNYLALSPLFNYRPDRLMFCSDDKHPDDLIEGHINLLVRRAISDGYDLYDVLRAACINPIDHYDLEVGQLRVGNAADFVIVEDLKNFNVISTYINGTQVSDSTHCLFSKVTAAPINQFNCTTKQASDFEIHTNANHARVIHALDGEIITKELITHITTEKGRFLADTKKDILTITVINRYEDAPPVSALIHGFGLSHGAIASCVGHDTHNIIAVGCDTHSIAKAVNIIIENKGGISAVGNDREIFLPLPFAGIMSGDEGKLVGKEYAELDRFAKDVLGSCLGAPYMTLSFMALLVIPDLKLSDKGLFSGKEFRFVDSFI